MAANWRTGEPLSNTTSRRRFIAGAVGVAGTVLANPSWVGAQETNLIATENQRPGTTAWRLTRGSGHQHFPISAFTRQASARAGDRVELSVVVEGGTTVSASVYRLGWYGGKGGRLMAGLGTREVSASGPASPDPATGEIAFATPASFAFDIADDWLSGAYVARVIDAAGRDAWAPFVVYDTRPADILFQHAIMTSAAYNFTPQGSGKSLYDHTSEGSVVSATGTQRAAVVSLDRPLHSNGGGDFFGVDIDLLHWLEREGYDVTYKTGMDVHEQPQSLTRHKILVSAGHDEYWTQEMFDGWKAARDAGVSLFISASNCAYWRVRLEPADDGRANRRVVCYKEAPDPKDPDTKLFRDVAEAEQTLFGLNWLSWHLENTRLVPTNTDHWAWAGTNVSEGVALEPRIVGYEVDAYDPNFALPPHTERTILASSPFVTWDNKTVQAETSLLRSTSGAWVFASGIISWAWGLGRSGFTSPQVQTATRNLVDRMLADWKEPAQPYKPFASAEDFVSQQINDYLGRTATSAELSLYVNRLTGDGATMSDVIEEIMQKAEFGSRAQVARLYLASFLRKPDGGGYEYWVGIRTGDTPLHRIADMFVGSPEFSETYGSPDHREFVRRIYSNVFGRDPDQEGWNYWVDRLDNGMTNGELLVNFSESAEGQELYGDRVAVVVTYQSLLRRPPNTSEYKSWQSRLATGTSQSSMIDGILGSDEYANRF